MIARTHKNYQPKLNSEIRHNWEFTEYVNEWRFKTHIVRRTAQCESVNEFYDLEADHSKLIQDDREFVSATAFPGYGHSGHFHISGPTDKSNQLPAGLYTLPHAGSYSPSLGLNPMAFRDNTYYDLGNAAVKSLNKLVETFKNEKKIAGTMRKANALLYGPHGNGKTAIAEKIARQWVLDGGIVIFMSGKDQYMESLKTALKDRDVMIIIEEVTNIMQKTTEGLQAPAFLLSMLDGQLSFDNSMTFVTTNYPELLPLNLVDRVGRFQELIEIDNPSALEIKNYLKIREVAPNHIAELVGLCKGYNLDFLINLTNQVSRGKPIVDIYEKLERHNKLAEKHFSKKGKLGIVPFHDPY